MIKTIPIGTYSRRGATSGEAVTRAGAVGAGRAKHENENIQAYFLKHTIYEHTIYANDKGMLYKVVDNKLYIGNTPLQRHEFITLLNNNLTIKLNTFFDIKIFDRYCLAIKNNYLYIIDLSNLYGVENTNNRVAYLIYKDNTGYLNNFNNLCFYNGADGGIFKTPIDDTISRYINTFKIKDDDMLNGTEIITSDIYECMTDKDYISNNLIPNVLHIEEALNMEKTYLLPKSLYDFTFAIARVNKQAKEIICNHYILADGKDCEYYELKLVIQNCSFSVVLHGATTKELNNKNYHKQTINDYIQTYYR